MRFSIASVLAFASVGLAQIGDNPTPGFNVITAPAKWEKVPAGKSYPIVWSPDAGHPGDITIKLYGGPAQDKLGVVETVATGVDGADGTFPWVVASTLGDKAVYGFQIILESNATIWQWGNPFEITSGEDTSSSASGSASGSASASASASASRSTSVSASATASSTKVSATVTSTTISESSKATSTFTRISSSSIHGNSTITHATDATVTTFTTGTASRGTATSSSTSSIRTNGAAAMGANGLALFGGVAMAVLAL